jgi:hypothetical protein
MSEHELHCDCRIELLRVAERLDEALVRVDRTGRELRRADVEREKGRQREAHLKRHVRRLQRIKRETLAQTLIYHQQTNTSGCHCGWGQRPEHLGASWPEHVADIYEQTLTEEATTDG